MENVRSITIFQFPEELPSPLSPSQLPTSYFRHDVTVLYSSNTKNPGSSRVLTRGLDQMTTGTFGLELYGSSTVGPSDIFLVSSPPSTLVRLLLISVSSDSTRTPSLYIN